MQSTDAGLRSLASKSGPVGRNTAVGRSVGVDPNTAYPSTREARFSHHYRTQLQLLQSLFRLADAIHVEGPALSRRIGACVGVMAVLDDCLLAQDTMDAIDVAPLLEGIAEAALDASDRTRIEVEAESCVLPTDNAFILGLVASELILRARLISALRGPRCIRVRLHHEGTLCMLEVLIARDSDGETGHSKKGNLSLVDLVAMALLSTIGATMERVDGVMERVVVSLPSPREDTRTCEDTQPREDTRTREDTHKCERIVG